MGIKLPENWNFDLEFCYCADDGRCYKSGWMLVIGADVLLDFSEKKNFLKNKNLVACQIKIYKRVDKSA